MLDSRRSLVTNFDDTKLLTSFAVVQLGKQNVIQAMPVR